MEDCDDGSHDNEIKKTKNSSKSSSSGNAFRNDGSFLELFKKMQNQKEKKENVKDILPALSSNSDDSSKKCEETLHKIVTKRKGPRILPTGMVKKQKHGVPEVKPKVPKGESSSNKNDPWSQYMDEVKRYKQQSCAEDGGTRRPLVK